MPADTLLVFGFCNGCPDVSVNAHSVYVEKAWAAAGRADPSAAGADVSRVTGLGSPGMLSGPAVIGRLTLSWR
ncbi:hypothetical protein [Streptomyces rhizosphaericus]|uniref:hypothetical protein n=1 Tax=Streptomyces rhizosphaericus TaxID=114699 RepID=UPI0028937432|nr:hypothetical protein [Streptomyces rhizosphaericus]